MAVQLLPLFEDAPQHWGAIEYLNTILDESRSFAQYLRDGSNSSPENHREFILQIAASFGVSF